MKDKKEFITLSEALDNPILRCMSDLPKSQQSEPIRPMVIGKPDYMWVNTLYSERSRGITREGE